MSDSFNSHFSWESSLGQYVKVHHCQMSKSRAAFFLSKSFDESIVDLSTSHKVFGEHQENALCTEVEDIIWASGQVIYEILCEGTFYRSDKDYFARNV